MTFEEIQNPLESMLAVQRELQNSQLKLQEESQRQRDDIASLRELVSSLREDVSILREFVSSLVQNIGDLAEISSRHERRIEQLIGYSITGESDRLDLQVQINDLKERVKGLEDLNQ